MEAAQRDKLQADLNAILLRRVKEIPRYGIFTPDGDALSQRFVTLIYAADGTPQAFATVKPLLVDHSGRQIRTALFGLAAVDGRIDSAYPLFSLYFAPLLWMYVGSGFRRFAVAACTMHPALVELVTRHFSDVYPDYRTPGQPTAAHAAVARHLAECHGADFGLREGSAIDGVGFVLRDTYSGPCASLRRDFHSLRPARDDRCNTYCQSVLDYARGDDLLMVGWVDWSAFWRNWPLVFKKRIR